MSKISRLKEKVKLDRFNRFKFLEAEANKGFVDKLKKLDIPLGKKIAGGANIDLYLPDRLNRLYGRKNLCLKVFKNSKTIWGGITAEGLSSIMESTMAQNLMAMRGLAPRVYDLVKIKGKTAQVTDYLVGEQKVVPIVDDRFNFNDKEIKMDYNFVAGKLVDFQAVVFKDFSTYKRNVIKKALGTTQFPRGQRGLYQSLNYYDGKRNTQERLALYKFKDFEGKKVFDIGCNLGMFSRTSVDLGARRVVGIDWPDIVEISEQLAILDGYFNIDFFGLDLKEATWNQISKLTGIKKFDIMLFLAQEMWIGRPEWLKNCNTLYYEGHGVKREFRIEYPNAE